MIKGQGESNQSHSRRNTELIHATEGFLNDKKFTFHTLNWLGWCVNDAPSMMIKRAGTDFVETVSGLQENTIEAKLDEIVTRKWTRDQSIRLKRNHLKAITLSWQIKSI